MCGEWYLCEVLRQKVPARKIVDTKTKLACGTCGCLNRGVRVEFGEQTGVWALEQ